MFSSRLSWNPSTNRITRIIEALRQSGIELVDLTGTNPTTAGFDYDPATVCRAISSPAILEYHPSPRGLIPARQAVVDYYRHHGKAVDLETVFLTASTSESYACIFKLLCDPGDTILAPRPSYPLFDFLAGLESIHLEAYRMGYQPDTGWQIDLEQIKSLTTPRTRAIILVNPNNPTGSYVRPHERDQLTRWCRDHDLALIVDEVFLDYAAAETPLSALSAAGNSGALTFTLSGISKVLGLPQFKLGWIQVSGPKPICESACNNLEMISDTYLSASTPVQVALPDLMAQRDFFQNQVIARIEANERYLNAACAGLTAGRMLQREGGWTAVIAMQNGISDEDMVCRLLESDQVLVHPGYFYDFDEDDCLVISLLTRPDRLTAGIDRLVSLFR
ncbi:MAG: pyridoxal phosphate-dependent aminotransferase [Deltaproteobacteria bacterium]|nr:pyridoxal phosphate-dependent aminotransferase [Deltaproteobacteria bacterium]